MAYSQRILDIMTTGSSMARLFYSPSLMSLLEELIPTREVYPIKLERPKGYSQSHWRKIQKERRRQRMRRETLDWSSHMADAMAYAFKAAATQTGARAFPETRPRDSTQ